MAAARVREERIQINNVGHLQLYLQGVVTKVNEKCARTGRLSNLE